MALTWGKHARFAIIAAILVVVLWTASSMNAAPRAYHYFQKPGPATQPAIVIDEDFNDGDYVSPDFHLDEDELDQPTPETPYPEHDQPDGLDASTQHTSIRKPSKTKQSVTLHPTSTNSLADPDSKTYISDYLRTIKYNITATATYASPLPPSPTDTSRDTRACT